MTTNEGSRRKFCRNEEEDAERTGLRIAANLPAYEADDGLELSVRKGFPEAVRESCRQEAGSRTSAKHGP